MRSAVASLYVGAAGMQTTAILDGRKLRLAISLVATQVLAVDASLSQPGWAAEFEGIDWVGGGPSERAPFGRIHRLAIGGYIFTDVKTAFLSGDRLVKWMRRCGVSGVLGINCLPIRYVTFKPSVEEMNSNRPGVLAQTGVMLAAEVAARRSLIMRSVGTYFRFGDPAHGPALIETLGRRPRVEQSQYIRAHSLGPLMRRMLDIGVRRRGTVPIKLQYSDDLPCVETRARLVPSLQGFREDLGVHQLVAVLGADAFGGLSFHIDYGRGSVEFAPPATV